MKRKGYKTLEEATQEKFDKITKMLSYQYLKKSENQGKRIKS
jgi:hypothetical protein